MPADTERDMLAMAIRDHKRMREAGCKLAEAALRVIRTYDGLHRLSLAVADWSAAIAAEGDRPHRDSDGTATAAANGDLPVPKDCQAQAAGIAQPPSGDS
jgi:hypothetical protein